MNETNSLHKKVLKKRMTVMLIAIFTLLGIVFGIHALEKMIMFKMMAKFMPKEVKFAELIVRECAEIAKKVDGDESDVYQSGRTWAGIDVLKQFGVEE